MFDKVLILDWSAAGSPTTGKDSIWLGDTSAKGTTTQNHPTRASAETALHSTLHDALSRGQRVFLGADFGFGYPTGFAKTLTGRASAFAVWEWLAQRISDTDRNAHNLRDVAAQMNAVWGGSGPFWGNTTKVDFPNLPRTKPPLPKGLASHRMTETVARQDGVQPKSAWQLAGVGAVGAQMLMGLPVLQRLRDTFANDLSVWPFQPATAQIVLGEVYPALLAADVKAACAADPNLVPDEAQVRLLSQALFAADPTTWGALLSPDAPPETLTEEGWILGAGQGLMLRRWVPARQTPPRLRNDCFAMPQGVDWIPVQEAQARLRQSLHPITGQETVTTAEAAGRILAQPCHARRANPPRPNAAVDGYGFAQAATGSGVQRLPLVQGRAAAGQPFDGAVPPGAAVRILTGAILPQGVDTVVLEEDIALDGAAVVFDGPIKPGANTRRAGEDVDTGAPVLSAGHVLRAPDLALLSAVGQAEVTVFRSLQVGVLSTGDEIIASPATPAKPHQIWDANRPMLLNLAQNWGYTPVDLGHVRDDRDAIADRLNGAVDTTDVILTSGGASAGDEDHVSALLRDRGTLSSWRIALKPGRPLALAVWDGVPVFGLPGNPVAALVCAAIFARPALSLLAGAGWQDPQGFLVPAAFDKRKKAGRREFLRARLNAQGEAEVFASEGSGRISGLSWADGLVELPDDAMTVTPGALVRYLPYTALGIA